MKKAFILTVCLVLMLFFVACGDKAVSQAAIADNTPQTEESLEEKTQTGDILVAYFAYSENMGDTSKMSVDAVTSASLNRATANTEGNLQVMAREISEKKGAGTFSILLQEPFDPDYSTMHDGVIEQIQNGTLPLLQSQVENIEQYRVVFLGIPVWANELPPAVRTFLTENDLTGKTIVPFGIHLGSGFGNMISQIEELCPDADILDGFTINAGTENEKVRAQVNEWLDASEIQ